MTGEQVTRRVYSAEELHRLRGSCSQPKLREAIEEHDSEDAELVKEHVLRGSRSFAARSFRSRTGTSGNSLRVPSNKENRSTTDAENSRPCSSDDTGVLVNSSVLGQIAPNSQILRPANAGIGPSPTPSLKKKKAEAIVKAHGSPQHIRVTAGGRIVPSEQSPLCHPRYGYSAIKSNGGLIKFAPNHPMGKAQWTQATQNGFIAQDVNGNLCQIVNGTILPLNEVDGEFKLYVPAPNLNVTSRTSSFSQGRFTNSDQQKRTPSHGRPASPPVPPLPAQTNALELEYSKLEHELKELDKTEVLHGRTMGKAAKEALVSKRRELVITLDSIRKAIKSIKSVPAPPEPATSPRVVQDQQRMSPVRNRLPRFLQQRPQHNYGMSMPPMPHTSGPFFGISQPPQYNGQYGLPTPNDMYNNTPFSMPQPPLYVPPPPFDGSMAPPYGGYADAMGPNPASVHSVPSNNASPSDSGNIETHLPQTDGAASISGLQKVNSPHRSHAVDIKAPDPKSAWAAKSSLNPMSPAYKPPTGVLQKTEPTTQPAAKSVKDRAPTPLSPLHQLKPAVSEAKAANSTDDTISPTKKDSHFHSSSISSFETADFFPRNTREYSTRKYAYPDPSQQSEDKENISPAQTTDEPVTSRDAHYYNDQATKLQKTSSDGHHSPTAPPGTPVNTNASVKPLPAARCKDSSQRSSHGFDVSAVPDRHAHNVSPKVKRQDFLFVHEDPSLLASLPSSSPAKYETCREQPKHISSSAGTIDFSSASREWIEGYRAGLASAPVESSRDGDFFDGYCAGLLKSKSSKAAPSTGSPMKSMSRRPSPSVLQSRSSSRMQHTNGAESTSARSPFENKLHSMDTLKEAVFAPQNEAAILSPSAEGPHIDEAPLNLGAWEKSQEAVAATDSMMYSRGDGLAGHPFPHRTASMLRRQGVMSEQDSAVKQHFQTPGTASESHMQRGSITSELSADEIPHDVAGLTTAMRGLSMGTMKGSNNRVASITSMDSNMYQQWPGSRVFSNQFGWKSATSLAQPTTLASALFSSGQVDGGPRNERPESIVSNPVMQTHSRFKEDSLEGITNPPNSPQVTSPPMSPSLRPTDGLAAGRKNDSPGKGVSPNKVKFGNIAEKVGIKVSSDKVEGGSPETPPSKRKWRALWRGGSRKEMSKDDGSTAAFEKSV